MNATEQQQTAAPAGAGPVMPESIQNPKLSFGETDNSWAQYDIYTAPVKFSDVLGKQLDTQYKAVFKSNKLVAIMSKRYQLLPNEKALEMADEIAEKIGFQQHKVYYSRDGNYMNATYLQSSDKGFWIDVNESSSDIEGDEKEARMQLRDAAVGQESKPMEERYAWNRSYEHKTDEVSFGFSIHNSINGTSGFGMGTRGGISAGYDQGENRGFGFRLFSLRKACMNGAIVRSNLFGSRVVTADKRFRIDTRRLEMPAIQANVRHTGNNADKFMLAVSESLKYVGRHLQALASLYKQWTSIQMDRSFAERLVFLPEKYLPDTVKVEGGKLTDEELYKSLSVWNAFNECTAKIWHSEKLEIRSKEIMTDKLHQALYVPAVTAGAKSAPAQAASE